MYCTPSEYTIEIHIEIHIAHLHTAYSYPPGDVLIAVVLLHYSTLGLCPLITPNWRGSSPESQVPGHFSLSHQIGFVRSLDLHSYNLLRLRTKPIVNGLAHIRVGLFVLLQHKGPPLIMGHAAGCAAIRSCLVLMQLLAVFFWPFIGWQLCFV